MEMAHKNKEIIRKHTTHAHTNSHQTTNIYRDITKRTQPAQKNSLPSINASSSI